MATLDPTATLPSRFRDPVNGFLHLFALVVSVAATGALALHAAPPRLPGILIYGFGMACCFLGSSLHHLVRGTPAREMRLLKWDHAAIYVYIAGTYTPVGLYILPAPGGLWLLAAMWACAAVGLVYKLGFAPDQADINDPPPLSDTLLYIAMGWLAVLQLFPLIQHAVAGSMALIAAGGISYSLGGLVLARRWLDVWPGRFGHHEFWHLFVMLGSAFLYAFLWVNLA